MTAPTNTFLTTAAIGNREDLTDTIYRISPTATPFISLAAKGKASNTLHEWQTQDLASAVSNNAQVEGDNASAKSVTPTVRLNNRTQISTKTVVVSGTQQAMNPAGRKDELAYQLSLAALELRRDMESSATQLDVNATAPRQSRGLVGWVVDNVNRNGGTLASYTGNTGRTKGTAIAFTEARLKDVLQKCFVAGGEPDSILLPPAAKQTFSTFTGNATRFDKSEDAKLYASVDVYVSDFGELKAIPSRFQDANDVFVLESGKWSIDYLRPFQTIELAQTGDAMQRELVVEWTVTARAPKANGAVYDVL
ncbi:MAG: phage head protein [Pseudomonas sp.]|nr:phage head protein [Pseudomonas sp.]